MAPPVFLTTGQTYVLPSDRTIVGLLCGGQVAIWGVVLGTAASDPKLAAGAGSASNVFVTLKVPLKTGSKISAQGTSVCIYFG